MEGHRHLFTTLKPVPTRATWVCDVGNLLMFIGSIHPDRQDVPNNVSALTQEFHACWKPKVNQTYEADGYHNTQQPKQRWCRQAAYAQQTMAHKQGGVITLLKPCSCNTKHDACHRWPCRAILKVLTSPFTHSIMSTFRIRLTRSASSSCACIPLALYCSMVACNDLALSLTSIQTNQALLTLLELN